MGLVRWSVHPASRQRVRSSVIAWGGQRDDGGVEAPFAQRAGGGVAVEPGHLDVHQHHVVPTAGGSSDRLDAVVGEFDRRAEAGQDQPDQGLIVLGIFGHQDAVPGEGLGGGGIIGSADR